VRLKVSPARWPDVKLTRIAGAESRPLVIYSFAHFQDLVAPQYLVPISLSSSVFAVRKAAACRFSMGLLSAVVVPLSEQLSIRSLGVVIAAGLFSFCVLAVVLNVLNQLLFKNPNEPPVVFHWFPVFGSTIVYGIDPYKFFFDCREKVY